MSDFRSINGGLSFQPQIIVKPLARRVLAIATTRVEGSWSAYIDAVEGISHINEQDAVLKRGTKLEETVARVLFPVFDELPYAE